MAAGVYHKGAAAILTHKGAPVSVYYDGVLLAAPPPDEEYDTPALRTTHADFSAASTGQSRTLTGVQPGDVVVAILRADSGIAPATITTAGWTVRFSQTVDATAVVVATKTATGTSEACAYTAAAGTRITMSAYSGVDESRVVVQSSVIPSSQSQATMPSVTLAHPSMVVGIIVADGSITAPVVPGGYTIGFGITQSTFWAYKAVDAAGVEAPGLFDWGTGRDAAAITLAIGASGSVAPPPEPEPEFIAASAGDGTVSTVSHPVTIPGPVVEGDLLVLTAVSTLATIALSGPNGWNERYNSTTPGAVGGMWTKTADSSDAAGGTVTVNTSIAARCAAVLTVYRDLAFEEAIMDGGSDYAMPSVTANADDWAILAWLAKSGDMTDLNPPAGVTERHTFAGSGAGHINTLHGDVADLPAGATPTYTATPVGGTSTNIFTGILRARPSITGNDEEPPPPGEFEPIVFGSTLVGNVAGTRAWEQEVGLPGTGGGTATPSNVGPTGVLRLFPLGSSNDTAWANTALDPRPSGLGPQTVVALSCKFTESDASAATMTSYLQTVQAIAEKADPGVKFLMALDAEYDRRTWVAQFPAKAHEFRDLQLVHAPSIEIVLNPSGYLFSQRIGDVWPAVQGTFDILGPSFYVYGGPAAQNGGYDAFTDAHEFAKANNLRFCTYEYGVSKTSAGATVVSTTQMNLAGYTPTTHAQKLAESIEFLAAFRDPHVEYAPYFEASVWATEIGDCRIGSNSGIGSTVVAEAFGDTIASIYA